MKCDVKHNAGGGLACGSSEALWEGNKHIFIVLLWPTYNKYSATSIMLNARYLDFVASVTVAVTAVGKCRICLEISV